jgi:hypothetical protein
VALGLALVAGGVALVAASSSAPIAPVLPAVELDEVAPPAPLEAPRAAVAASEAAAPIPNEIKLVFRADGASFLRLADIDRDAAGALRWPRHAAPRLLKEDGAEIAIAAVGEADVPVLHRGWAGRQVVVDGRCRATITGFAVVSRLYGDTAYAGLDKEAWDAASVMQSGSQVLAARLDNCTGTYARDAALAPVVVPEELQDAPLAAAARRALIASAAAEGARQSWAELGQPETGPWWEHAELKTRVLRHPGTGATFVAVHAHAELGCGTPDLNVWGLYRAAADGTLSPVHEQRFERLHAVDQIIDIEGDGELELIGRSWLGDIVIAGADGSELDSLDIQFYGCPC